MSLELQEEIDVLREEVQRLCNENHQLKKEKEEVEESLQRLYKQVYRMYGDSSPIVEVVYCRFMFISVLFVMRFLRQSRKLMIQF